MKKIIALAVASAFVAPAFAADVTVGGHVEFTYTAEDGSADIINSGETEINLKASEELSGGYTITASINVIDDDTATGTDALDMQATNLAISGPIGTVAIGDTSGALDATGDWTDIAPAGGNFDTGDGNDMAINWTLPTLVEGLTVNASMSPEGTNTTGSGAAVANDANAFSVTYSMNGVSVYYGSESVGAVEETDAYGIKGTIAGVALAYEQADHTTSSNVDRKIKGFAASYKMGDIVLGYENQSNKQDSNASYSKKETVMFAEYNWGSNVDIYVSAKDVDEVKVSSGKDATYVGVEYAF